MVVIRCETCGEALAVREEPWLSRPGTYTYLECGCGTVGRDRPAALDLFCGVGGVGRSIARHGSRAVFDVVGVDADAGKAEKYPDVFIEHDLRDGLPDPLREVMWDLAWASPPCQFATGLQFRRSGENLIPVARDILDRVDAEVTVIENVPDAAEHLQGPAQFCGSAFGLGVQKHRVFEANFPLRGTECDHPDRFPFCIGDREAPVEEYRRAHGFWPDDPMTAKEVRECIPPAYVAEIIRQHGRAAGPTVGGTQSQASLARFVATGGGWS